MIETASGLILRVRPLTETSLIVHWLTPKLGRIATVAKGARRSKSPFAGKLDLFYAADFSFQRSRRSDLHTLREVKLQTTHHAIREDILKLQQAGYATALIERATEAETPLPEIFELMRGFLAQLCQQPAQAQLVFALELKLLRELGLEPDFDNVALTPGAKKLVHAILQNDWAGGSRLKLSVAQHDELQRFFQNFLALHLGHVPRGRTAALAEHG
jgi:DNA repair protein RecO (recombination protein O)